MPRNEQIGRIPCIPKIAAKLLPPTQGRQVRSLLQRIGDQGRIQPNGARCGEHAIVRRRATQRFGEFEKTPVGVRDPQGCGSEWTFDLRGNGDDDGAYARWVSGDQTTHRSEGVARLREVRCVK